MLALLIAATLDIVVAMRVLPPGVVTRVPEQTVDGAPWKGFVWCIEDTNGLIWPIPAANPVVPGECAVVPYGMAERIRYCRASICTSATPCKASESNKASPVHAHDVSLKCTRVWRLDGVSLSDQPVEFDR